MRAALHLVSAFRVTWYYDELPQYQVTRKERTRGSSVKFKHGEDIQPSTYTHVFFRRLGNPEETPKNWHVCESCHVLALIFYYYYYYFCTYIAEPLVLDYFRTCRSIKTLRIRIVALLKLVDIVVLKSWLFLFTTFEFPEKRQLKNVNWINEKQQYYIAKRVCQVSRVICYTRRIIYELIMRFLL